MENTIQIKLSNIGKKYNVYHHKASLVASLFNRGSTEKFWALKRINLTVRKGDQVGIIGPNGSGKSTLLKIIAGITAPTHGDKVTRGKIVTITDLEAGFHPDLSGEENIYVNGLLIGMNRTEISAKKRQIIQFADIGNFISAPFYTYSAGMKFRLAFAVAMASECDVLLMDEVFIAGDVYFQSKVSHLLLSLQKTKQVTTILCSHVPVLLWKFAKTYYHLTPNGLVLKSKREVLQDIHKEAKVWNANFVESKKDFKYGLLG